ncbi:MAG: hypothetical protein RIC19_23110, partial [Phaeodactylibacter sp.]|uniref:hypothetical protein n=1 Tax=Phaeodactylibacter sp. TaxID=1940289 RepID=UPI0032ECD4E2
CSCLKKLALLKVAPSLRRGHCFSSLAFFDKGRACDWRRQYGVARTFTLKRLKSMKLPVSRSKK